MFVRPDKSKLAGAWIIPAPLIDKFEAWSELTFFNSNAFAERKGCSSWEGSFPGE